MTAKVIEFSTDALPSRNRNALILDFYSKIAMGMDVEAAPESPIDIRSRTLIIPDLIISQGNTSALTGSRSNQMRADGNTNVMISFPDQPLIFREKGKDALVVQEGDAIISSLDCPFSVTSTQARNVFLTVQIPRSLMGYFMSNLDDSLHKRIEKGRPGLDLFYSYARTLAKSEVPAGLGATASRHLAELAALSLKPLRNSSDGQRSSMRAARFSSAKSLVIQELHRSTLSAAFVAQRLGVSTRYIYMLFEEQGLSFGAFVREQRLLRASMWLQDPDRRNQRILDIAYDVGFGDVGTFNRAFRKHFEQSPNDMRQEAKRQGVRFDPPQRI